MKKGRDRVGLAPAFLMFFWWFLWSSSRIFLSEYRANFCPKCDLNFFSKFYLKRCFKLFPRIFFWGSRPMWPWLSSRIHYKIQSRNLNPENPIPNLDLKIQSRISILNSDPENLIRSQFQYKAQKQKSCPEGQLFCFCESFDYFANEAIACFAPSTLGPAVTLRNAATACWGISFAL